MCFPLRIDWLRSEEKRPLKMAFWQRLRLLSPMLLVMLAVLAACQNNDGADSLTEALPLDETRPTLSFFFTDG